jgi:hypothetical protein
MKFNPKETHFKFSDPKTKEQKLIVALTDDHHELTKAFIRLNKSDISTEDLFEIIRDSAICYTLQTIHSLSKMMANKSEIPLLIKDCEDIFKAYMNNILEDIE